MCAPVVLRVRCPRPLGACSPVRALGVLCVRCQWPLSACSSLRAPCVLRVRCPWTLGACSALCALVVLSVRYQWHGGSCLCAACALCGMRRRVAVLCVPCVPSMHPACLRVLGVLVRCVFLGVVVVAWHLIPCIYCGRRLASLACLLAPHWRAVPSPVRVLLLAPLKILSPWCLPMPGACARGKTGQLPGARGGRLRSRLMVPSAGRRCGWMLESLSIVNKRQVVTDSSHTTHLRRTAVNKRLLATDNAHTIRWAHELVNKREVAKDTAPRTRRARASGHRPQVVTGTVHGRAHR